MAGKTTVLFALERETPGTYRYYEVDKIGNTEPTPQAYAKIGTLYIKKRAISGNTAPRYLWMEINWGDEVTSK